MINVAVIGASGYTGLELMKILLVHPEFEISYIGNTEGGTTISKLHKCLKNVIEVEVSKTNANEIAKVAELAFLALPHQASMQLARELLALNVKVVDLSADYRLEQEAYEQYYCKHNDIEGLSHAVYGLPEFYKNDIKGAKLIANPGCYPTATLLGILPFMEYIADGEDLFVDAKSGVSGAGKKLTETSHFVTINENLFAYNPIKHRHSPEIKEKIQKVGHKNLNVTFVPHLLPLTRGMIVSSYVKLTHEIDNPIEILKDFYKDNRFIRIFDTPVDIKSASGTNFCDIFATTNGKALFVSSAIDNLLRGASAQAVVNANLMCGFDEDLAIPFISYVP